jgi:hypothetical protein
VTELDDRRAVLVTGFTTDEATKVTTAVHDTGLNDNTMVLNLGPEVVAMLRIPEDHDPQSWSFVLGALEDLYDLALITAPYGIDNMFALVVRDPEND